MKTQIETVHFDADEKLLDHIEKKIAALDNHHSRIENCKAVLKLNKNSKNKNKLIEINVSIPGTILFAKEQAETFELATDLVIDKIKKQLHKHKTEPDHISIEDQL